MSSNRALDILMRKRLEIEAARVREENDMEHLVNTSVACSVDCDEPLDVGARIVVKADASVRRARDGEEPDGHVHAVVSPTCVQVVFAAQYRIVDDGEVLA